MRSKLEGATFWKVVDALLAPDGSKLLRQKGEVRTAFLSLAEGQFATFSLAVCYELLSAVPVRGVILSDQVRSLDWRSRGAELICSVPDETAAAVLRRLQTLVGA